MARKTVTRTMMIEAATQAGLTVRVDGDRIFINRIGRGATSVVVEPSGSIWRTDVRLGSAQRMYPRDVAKLFGLTFAA